MATTRTVRAAQRVVVTRLPFLISTGIAWALDPLLPKKKRDVPSETKGRSSHEAGQIGTKWSSGLPDRIRNLAAWRRLGCDRRGGRDRGDPAGGRPWDQLLRHGLGLWLRGLGAAPGESASGAPPRPGGHRHQRRSSAEGRRRRGARREPGGDSPGGGRAPE